MNGLDALPDGVDLVVIHDGVRPFIKPDKIRLVIDSAAESGAAILAAPVRDTLKKGRTTVEQTLERRDMWLVQTPQVFRTEWIREAYRAARRDGIQATDDAMLVERLGHPVQIVEGEPSNFKVTSPADLRIAEMLLERGNP